MANTRIGKLLPRYSFMLNPHAEVRLSKCPKCQKVTHLRKFALLIHIDEWGPMVLGTMQKNIWRAGLDGQAKPLARMLKHVADFKHQYELDYKPGGWYPATDGPKKT